MPLAVIGKSKKPRTFKNINCNLLPVKYYAQNNAWMSKETFQQWLKEEFRPQVLFYLRKKYMPE